MTLLKFILITHSVFSLNLNRCSTSEDSTKISVIGTAVVIKSHAAVKTDDSLIYYLDGITKWDEKYLGNRVKVVGKKFSKDKLVVLKSPNPKIKARPQPHLRDGFYLRNAKWKLIKR